MQPFFKLLCAAIFSLAFIANGPAYAFAPQNIAGIEIQNLPKEARETLSLIKRGGTFPYSQDGVVFGNRENILPAQKRGYYHEYTVKTPGVRNRGTRRIITGKQGEYYYTDDHYASFKRIKE